MRKITCIIVCVLTIISIAFCITSCKSREKRLNEETTYEDKQMHAMEEKVIGCIKNDDKEGLKKLFSKRAQKDIEDLVKQQIRERYLKEQGGSSFEKVHSYNEKYKAYAKTRNGPERMSVLYTIEELKFSEMDKIMGYIKSKVPGWHHPKPYDPAIVQEYINQEEGKENKDINISV